MVSKSNFNRKINRLLVRIFQQGWYFYDQKRPNFQKMQKTQYRNFHFLYTLNALANFLNERVTISPLYAQFKTRAGVKTFIKIYVFFITIGIPYTLDSAPVYQNVKPKISAVSPHNNRWRPYWSFPLIKKCYRKHLKPLPCICFQDGEFAYYIVSKYNKLQKHIHFLQHKKNICNYNQFYLPSMYDEINFGPNFTNIYIGGIATPCHATFTKSDILTTTKHAI